MENNTFKFKSLGIRLEKYEQFQDTGSDILGKKRPLAIHKEYQ
jgi:hypothetical protein